MDIGNNLAQESVIGLSQTNAFGEFFFSNLNGSTFSKISAAGLFEQELSTFLFDKYKLYVIIGTDSGLLPQYIHNHGIPEGSRYIFIEPAVVLRELQEAGVLLDTNDKFAFVNESTWIEALERFKIKEYFYIQSVQSVASFCAREDAMGLYSELNWLIVEDLKQRQYRNNTTLGGQHFIIQQILNFADSYSPCRVLKDVFKGKTAFVLGGGTSLDEALPWLIKNRASIVIIAVSRISKRLIEFGLQPDFVCSVDPFEVNWDVSKEIFSLDKKTAFVYSYHLYHGLVNQWTGRSFYCGDRVPWDSSLNEENLSLVGPTVTNGAIRLAVYLGFSKIYLAGVDYCFTLDGFTHAQGSIESAAGARFNLIGTVVENYEGLMAPTGLDYLFARDSLIEQLKQYSSAQFYNVALRAAKVEGVEYCPVDSISVDKTPIDVEAILAAHSNKGKSAEFLAKALKEIQHIIYQLKEIKKWAKEAYELNEVLYDEDGLGIDYKAKLSLDKLEKKIVNKYKELSLLIKKFGIRQFLKMTKPFTDEHQLTAEEAKLSLRIYYQSYIDGASILAKLIEKAEEHIIARIEEHQPQPNWDLLITYCHKEKCYGRVRLWRQLEAAQHLTKEQKAAFDELERLFIAELGALKSDHTQAVFNSANLTSLKTRAQILFKHKQKDSLEHLLFALDKHYDQKGVIPYRYLIRGYLSELEGNVEHALECYSQIIDLAEGPLEEALLHVVSLDLKTQGQGDLAHQALECLAQMNSRYLLFYAESCRIKGNVLEAIDAYMLHITTYPRDVITQLKLAQLFMDQHINDGAETMLNLILGSNPHNEMALMLKEQLANRTFH